MQDAMIEVLKYTPRFISHSQNRFRHIMVRIIENVLRDKNDWHRARRRAMSRERPIPSDSVIDLDRPHKSVTQPGSRAQENEHEMWVRLALEFLPAIDRQVILMRQWDERSFPEIAEELGVSADSVRMRFNRAVSKLGLKILELRAGTDDGLT